MEVGRETSEIRKGKEKNNIAVAVNEIFFFFCYYCFPCWRVEFFYLSVVTRFSPLVAAVVFYYLFFFLLLSLLFCST